LLLSTVFLTVFIRPQNTLVSSYAGWKFYFIFISSVITIIGLKSILFKKEKLKLKLNILDIFIILYFVYVFIRLIFTKYAHVESTHFEIFTLFIAIYFIWKVFFSSNFEQDKINTPVLILLSGFLITGFVESLVGILQLYNILPGYVNSYFKVNGTFTSPDHYAGYLSALIPFSFGIFKFTQRSSRSKIFLKYLSLITFLTSLFILPVVRERSSFLAVIAAIIFIYLYDPKIKKLFISFTDLFWKKIILGLIAVFLLFVSAKIMYNYRPVSVNGRLLIWKISGKMIEEHPVWGTGYNRYAVEYLNYQAEYFKHKKLNDSERFLASNIKHAHNEFIQTYAELGILGFLLLAGIIITALFENIKKNKFNPKEETLNAINISAKASLLSIIIISLFSFPFHVLPNYINFIFMLGLIGAIINFKKKNSELNKVYEIKMSRYFVIIASLIVTSLTAFIIYKNINRFNEYKIWKDGYDKASFGNYSNAIKDFDKIYGSLKNNGNYLFNYGGVLLLNKNYKKAVNILNESTKTYTDAKQHIDLGIAYENLNDIKKAKNEFLFATNMKPDQIYPEYLLTKLYIKEGKIISAKLEAERILNREVHINSTAVQEIKSQIKTLLKSINIETSKKDVKIEFSIRE
jgi:O-antigen polymerase